MIFLAKVRKIFSWLTVFLTYIKIFYDEKFRNAKNFIMEIKYGNKKNQVYWASYRAEKKRIYKGYYRAKKGW